VRLPRTTVRASFRSQGFVALSPVNTNVTPFRGNTFTTRAVAVCFFDFFPTVGDPNFCVIDFDMVRAPLGAVSAARAVGCFSRYRGGVGRPPVHRQVQTAARSYVDLA